MNAAPPSLADIPSAKEWERPGLSPGGLAIARAAIEAMLSEGTPPNPADPTWVERVARAYDLSIGVSSLQVRLGVRSLVVLLEWLPVVVLGVPSRMSRLTLEDRMRYLEALESHRFAPLVMLLVATKVPMLMSAFESGDALKLTGYDRPSTFARRRLPVAREEGRP